MKTSNDANDMRSLLIRFPAFILDACKIAENIRIKIKPSKIVVAGMGGSGFAGDLLSTYLKKIPVFVSKGYYLPGHVDDKTLVWAISYSGNTEETISCYREALRTGAEVISIASKGKLKELSEMHRTPIFTVPGGIPPRLATPYLFFPILRLLENSGVVQEHEDVISKTQEALDYTLIEDRARELARRIKGRTPIMYASQRFWCVAEKWKTDINENAKSPAFYNVFPECNHNEINAYANLIGDYYVIFIRDNQEHPRILKCINIIKKLIRSKGVDTIEVGITGTNYLTRLFSGIYLGLWVSYFLALEYGIDPTPVEIIENLKKELSC